MGIVAGLFALNQVGALLPAQGFWNFMGLGVFVLFALGILYWVDTSIVASRRSDPLDRDTFHWSVVRRIIWVTALASFFLTILTGIVLPTQVGNSLPGWVNLGITVLFYFPIYSAAVSAVVVIPVAARRCRDLVFRRHLEYFFVFVVIQLVLGGTVGQFFQTANGNATSSSEMIDAIGVLIGFYPLLVSVKRHVPLYRFGDEGPSEGGSTTPLLLDAVSPHSVPGAS